MKIIISAALAYVMLGLAKVTDDLSADAVHKRGWAFRPTFGKALLFGATWFIQPIVDAIHTEQVARHIAFGLLQVIIQMIILTSFNWCCITAASYIFTGTIPIILTSGALIIVGGRLILPWLNLLLIPFMLAIAWPLDLLFPIKDRDSRD